MGDVNLSTATGDQAQSGLAQSPANLKRPKPPSDQCGQPEAASPPQYRAVVPPLPLVPLSLSLSLFSPGVSLPFLHRGNQQSTGDETLHHIGPQQQLELGTGDWKPDLAGLTWIFPQHPSKLKQPQRLRRFHTLYPQILREDQGPDRGQKGNLFRPDSPHRSAPLRNFDSSTRKTDPPNQPNLPPPPTFGAGTSVSHTHTAFYLSLSLSHTHTQTPYTKTSLFLIVIRLFQVRQNT
ncbi:hypothetical protein CPAR01_13345 [Colletotrichum paranaense]|uniref:Uncharacterized protein n=1 Tax=Colletotrichum paranaense TaxID=1914294 RepID=A0ABQ9S5Q3_9PEZI|nr:uncharacterized protein CPAR01_13345 [Colletotrichum paranaense]KAK1526817.1 hypothetical protein CPAR01_13345 [Colletotrichum paranaense]